MDIKELYVKTIFCCMACDGEIAKEEVVLVCDMASQEDAFRGMNVGEIINNYVALLNIDGVLFLKRYLKELETQQLSEEEQSRIVDFAIRIILADKKIEYSEIKFFKKIRSRLPLTDEQILAKHPDVEDFLLPDINVAEDIEWENIVLENINFMDYERKQ